MGPPNRTEPDNATRGRLQDIVAVVTGASSGIGRGIAQAYAREGAIVVCADLTAEPYNKGNIRPVHQPSGAPPNSIEADTDTATHEIIIAQYGEGRAIFVPIDHQLERASPPEAPHYGMADLMEKATAVTGRIDVMVNCAGVGIFAIPAHETSLHDWNRSMSLNATGPFLGTKHALAQFLKQERDVNGFRGAVINITSIGATIGLRGCVAYCAAKGAVDSFSRSVAIDYASEGIRCNTIAPGYTATPWLQPSLDTEPGFMEYLHTWTPMQRLARPAELSGAAVWLAAGQESGFVTGTTVDVDGGFKAR